MYAIRSYAVITSYSIHYTKLYEQAARIRAGLLAAGAPAALPVALVVAGTTANQRVEVTSLACLEQQAEALLGLSPVLMILGEVVGLREALGQTIEQTLRSVA